MVNNKHPIFGFRWSLGQRAADRLTKFAGSWTFILGFLFFIALWILINSYFLINYFSEKVFDPFPFILLNLALSCLAALQAPVILMSQNRSSQRDRFRAEYDHKVNVRAEKGIREIKEMIKKLKR